MLTRMWNSVTLTSWASVAIRGLSLVLVLPLLLTRLSPAEVALWYLLATVIGLQGLADLGLAPTFTRIIAFGMAGRESLDSPGRGTGRVVGRAPNWGLIGAIWHTMRRVYVRLALVSLLVVAVGGTFAMLRPMRALPDPGRGWVAWVVVLIVSAVVLGGNAFSAYLQGVGEVVLVRRWDAISGAAAVLTSFVVLLAGGRLLSLVLANQSWAIVAVARNWQFARRAHGGKLPTLRPGNSAEVMRAVWPSAWRSGLGIAASRGVTQATGVVFAQLGSSTDVASYLIGLRIMQLLADLSAAPLGSQLPLWAQLRAAGRRADLLAVAQTAMRLTYWTFAVGLITGGAAGPWLFRVVDSQTPFVDGRVWALFGLGFFLERYGAAHIQLYSTTNRIIWHVANGVTGLIIVGTSAALLPRMGVYAFAISFVVANAGFYAWYAALHSYRHDGIPVVAFERTTVLPPLGAVVAYGAFVFLAPCI